MTKADVTIHPKTPDAEVEVETLAITVEGVDRLSFIDGGTHGPAKNFGITEDFEGKALLICSPNVIAVEVEAR